MNKLGFTPDMLFNPEPESGWWVDDRTNNTQAGIKHIFEQVPAQDGIELEKSIKDFSLKLRDEPRIASRDPEKTILVLNSKYIDNLWDNIAQILYDLLYSIKTGEVEKKYLQKIDLHHLMDFKATDTDTAKKIYMSYYTKDFLKEALDKGDFDLAIKIANVAYDIYDTDDNIRPYQTEAVEEIYNQLEENGDVENIEKLLNSVAFTNPKITDHKDAVWFGQLRREKIKNRYHKFNYDLVMKQAKFFINEKIASIEEWNKEELKNQIIDFIQKLNSTLQDHQKNTYAKEISFYVAIKFAEKGLYYEAGELLAKHLKLSSLEK